MGTKEYSATKTLSKGLGQFINIISSAAFSGLLVTVFKELFDKEFTITDIQSVIENISGSVMFLTPFISSGIQMFLNFKKNFKAK